MAPYPKTEKPFASLRVPQLRSALQGIAEFPSFATLPFGIQWTERLDARQ
jgi:hypothetical protein